jgi:hypothetical protein
LLIALVIVLLFFVFVSLGAGKNSNPTPGIMSIGYVSALDAELAATAIGLNGFPPLLDAIDNEEEDHIKSASAWSISQIGKHGPSHALAAARAGALPKLLSALLHPSSSADLRSKCRRALGALLPHLAHLEPLDSLLQVGITSPDPSLISPQFRVLEFGT